MWKVIRLEKVEDTAPLLLQYQVTFIMWTPSHLSIVPPSLEIFHSMEISPFTFMPHFCVSPSAWRSKGSAHQSSDQPGQLTLHSVTHKIFRSELPQEQQCVLICLSVHLSVNMSAHLSGFLQLHKKITKHEQEDKAKLSHSELTKTSCRKIPETILNSWLICKQKHTDIETLKSAYFQIYNVCASSCHGWVCQARRQSWQRVVWLAAEVGVTGQSWETVRDGGETAWKLGETVFQGTDGKAAFLSKVCNFVIY